MPSFFWFRLSSWVVNIIFNIATPFILFAEGLPALMAAILKGRKYNDDTYFKAAILHFFPLLEYLGAFILYLHEKQFMEINSIENPFEPFES